VLFFRRRSCLAPEKQPEAIYVRVQGSVIWRRSCLAHYTAAGAVAALKVPPHSVEAEQAVLGGLMQDNTVWDDVAEVLQPEDFYRHEHQQIFAVMMRQVDASKPLDVVTLVEALDSSGRTRQCRWPGIPDRSGQSCPRYRQYFSAYTQIIRERATLRTLIRVSSEIADNAFNPAGRPAADVLDMAEQKVFQIADQRARDSGPQQVNPLLNQSRGKN
jgi:replicative DNA helicase